MGVLGHFFYWNYGDTFQIEYPSEGKLELTSEILQKLERNECEFDRVEKELRCMNYKIQTKNCHYCCFDVCAYLSQEALWEIDEKIILKDLNGSIKASSSRYINKDTIMVPSLASKLVKVGFTNQWFIEFSLQCHRRTTYEKKT